MAELRVERKRPSIWRWIVLLLIVALLVWAIVELFGGEDSAVIEDDPIGALLAPPGLATGAQPLPARTSGLPRFG